LPSATRPRAPHEYASGPLGFLPVRTSATKPLSTTAGVPRSVARACAYSMPPTGTKRHRRSFGASDRTHYRVRRTARTSRTSRSFAPPHSRGTDHKWSKKSWRPSCPRRDKNISQEALCRRSDSSCRVNKRRPAPLFTDTVGWTATRRFHRPWRLQYSHRSSREKLLVGRPSTADPPSTGDGEIGASLRSQRSTIEKVNDY